MGSLRRVALFLSVGARALFSSPALAAEVARSEESIEQANLDTTYGRLDGDLAMSFGAGATFGPSAPRGTVDLRARYLDTAGIFVSYEDGLSATSSDPRRVVAAGFEVRPLFLSRWLVGRELSKPWLDLFIDSFGLELGVFFEQPSGASFESRPGLQAGIGLELPLLPRASGPWIGIHGGGRWSDGSLGGETAGAVNRAAFLSVTIAYHRVFATHLVDARDAAPW